MEVTWNDATASTPWQTPGGDYDDDIILAEIDYSDLGGDGTSSFTTIPLKASVVQDWVSEPSSNFGFLMRLTKDETPNYNDLYNFTYLWSHNQPTNSESKAPALEITYVL